MQKKKKRIRLECSHLELIRLWVLKVGVIMPQPNVSVLKQSKTVLTVWLFAIVSSHCLYFLKHVFMKEGHYICGRWGVRLSMLTAWQSRGLRSWHWSSNTSETVEHSSWRERLLPRETNMTKASLFIISYETAGADWQRWSLGCFGSAVMDDTGIWHGFGWDSLCYCY